jgi:hypothetical protein
MDKREIIILSAAMVFVAIRLYQRYKKKENNNLSSGSPNKSSSDFPSSSKEDDYEPYSKK